MIRTEYDIQISQKQTSNSSIIGTLYVFNPFKYEFETSLGTFSLGIEVLKHLTKMERSKLRENKQVSVSLPSYLFIE